MIILKSYKLQILTDVHPIKESLIKGKKSVLRSISGQLAWVTNQKRPDLAFGSY